LIDTDTMSRKRIQRATARSQAVDSTSRQTRHVRTFILEGRDDDMARTAAKRPAITVRLVKAVATENILLLLLLLLSLLIMKQVDEGG